MERAFGPFGVGVQAFVTRRGTRAFRPFGGASTERASWPAFRLGLAVGEDGFAVAFGRAGIVGCVD